MVGAKKKGSAAERELLDVFWENGYAVIRAAGSGSTSHDACDLIVGRGGKSLAIEVKACAGAIQYVSAGQMHELLQFSGAFGAAPYVAVKWTRKGWGIVDATKLRTTGKHHAIRQAEMEPLADWLAKERLGFDVHA